MPIQNLLDPILQNRILSICIKFNMDTVEFKVDPAVRPEIMTARKQITDERRIRGFSLRKM